MAHRIFTTSFASIYPLYVTKAERKGRTKAEVDQVIGWLTGYDHDGLARVLADETDVQTFFDQAPAFNPNASLIKGVICGHRVEEIDDPLMQKVRYLEIVRPSRLVYTQEMDAILRTPVERVETASEPSVELVETPCG